MDLCDVDQWHHPSELLSASRVAARDIIRQTLLPSSDEGRTLRIKSGLEYYQYLPTYISYKIDLYVPRSCDRRDPRDLDTLSHKGRDASLTREMDEIKRRLAEARQQLEELRKSTSHKDKDSTDKRLETATPQV